MKSERKILIFTIGHSTHSIDELVKILRAHGIKRVVDIRTIPRSRHNPQYNREDLSRALRNRRIGYRHMKSLGGLRHARKDSPNVAWENASFRGFADYMQTAEFQNAIGKLIAMAVQKPTAIMCAEVVPWRCHRSLVADALVVRGLEVHHIYSATNARPHLLSGMARLVGGRLTYPA